LLRARYDDQFVILEFDYNRDISHIERVFISWVIYGQKPSPYHYAIEVEPPLWASEASRDLGHDPIRWDKYYAGGQIQNDWIDLRVMLIAVTAKASSPAVPHLELRRLRIAQVTDHVDLISQGWLDSNRADWALGADIRLTRNFSAKLLYGSNNFEWSVGFRTYLNR
jgi:hypothetical protein